MKLSKIWFYLMLFLIFLGPGIVFLGHAVYVGWFPIPPFHPTFLVLLLPSIVILSSHLLVYFWWVTLPYYIAAYGTLYLLVKKGKLEIK